jgi:hypothetical protein
LKTAWFIACFQYETRSFMINKFNKFHFAKYVSYTTNKLTTIKWKENVVSFLKSSAGFRKYESKMKMNRNNFLFVYKRGLPGAARDYTNKFLFTNPPQRATFVCWPLPNSQSIHPHLVGCTLGPRFRVSPPQIKFDPTNPSRGATFVFWPPPNS